MTSAGTAVWRVRGRELPVGGRTLLMGILNVTPDSFSDGGAWADPGAAVERGRAMLEEGADLLDVGGESSRPGAAPVPADEERRRVVPVIAALAREPGVVISVDTTKADVAEAALDAGAAIVNDISALRFDPALAVLAGRTRAGLVLMHMQGTPGTMQRDPRYADVVAEVRSFLAERVAAARAAGVAPEAVAVDPGIGFGKTADHNYELLHRLGELASLGCPVLVGPSRKAFIGAALGGAPVGERLEGTAAAVALAIAGGAAIVRVHDVRVMGRVARVADAVARRPGR